MIRATDLLREAFALLRRERNLVLSVAAPFLFLPALALQLLIAPPPTLPETRDQAAMTQWLDALMVWGRPAAPWYLLGDAVGLFGAAVVAMLFVGRTRPDVRTALIATARLMPRIVLTGVLTAIPVGLGLWVFVLPGLFMQARLSAAIPLVVLDGTIPAARALAQSWRMTASASFGLFAAVVALFTMQWIVVSPLVLLDATLRAPGHLNPFVLALVDGGIAAFGALFHVGVLLLGIVAYRRGASRGM